MSSQIQFSPVSRRYSASGDPLDAEWARKRKTKRILRAIARAQKKQARKGSFLTAWLRTFNAGLQERARATADEHYRGQEYDYSKVPDKPGNVIIAFAGATQGPGRGLDKYLFKRYGGQNYAIFRPADVGKAVQFAKRLPKGSKIFVQGHSHGGAAAAQFAQSGLPIERLITYDPVAGVGKPAEKYPNVKKWYNAVAGDYDYTKDSNLFTWLPKKLAGDAADVFIRGAGKWGKIKGAVNVSVSGASHSDVEKMYNAIQRRIAKGASLTYREAYLYKKAQQFQSLQEQNQANTFHQITNNSKQNIQKLTQMPRAVENKKQGQTKVTVQTPPGTPAQQFTRVN